MEDSTGIKITRRAFLITGATSAAAITLPTDVTAQTSAAKPVVSKVSFQVNGTLRELELDTRTTLLDALREHLHLTGSKKGCDHGQCGACTVIVNGRRMLSCLTLAVMQEGNAITTIEGLGKPGQICSAVAMLDEIKAGVPSHVSVDLTVPPQPTAVEFRERMSGNICRCGAYSNIVDAITEVSGSKP